MIRAAAWFLLHFSVALGVMAVALIAKWPLEIGLGVIFGTGLVLVSTMTWLALKDGARQASGGSRGTTNNV